MRDALRDPATGWLALTGLVVVVAWLIAGRDKRQ